MMPSDARCRTGPESLGSRCPAQGACTCACLCHCMGHPLRVASSLGTGSTRGLALSVRGGACLPGLHRTGHHARPSSLDLGTKISWLFCVKWVFWSFLQGMTPAHSCTLRAEQELRSLKYHLLAGKSCRCGSQTETPGYECPLSGCGLLSILGSCALPRSASVLDARFSGTLFWVGTGDVPEACCEF
jgi:hypothetical protein